MGFPIFEQQRPELIVGVLSIEQKKKLVDVYKDHNTFQDFFHMSVKEGCYPECDNLFELVQYAFNSIETIINEVQVCMREVLPKDDKELKLALKIEKFGHCDQEALDYVIDTMIKWSNGKGDNSYETFKTYFNANE